MTVWALGLNHTTAPLDLRGKFAFASDRLGAVLNDLQTRLQATLSTPLEATILSTCNRTELYCSGEQSQLDQTMNWFAQTGGVSLQTLSAHSYMMSNQDVARHAFRVASGLDSMVLGEPQILGQMKQAVQCARGVGALGTTLNQLFERSFSVAKKVRSTTEIGSHSISMSAASVRLAAQLFEDLTQINVLFVGAGEMIEMCTAHFKAKNPKSMTITNRSAQRGEELAHIVGAKTMPLMDLPERLHEFDAIISCTASTLPLIGLGAVERALKRRKNKPLFMVDLAVPRDIEPDVKKLTNVYLYTVDDLAHVVQKGKANRLASVDQAEIIIDQGVESFTAWLANRNEVPLIHKLNAKTNQWREIELARAKKMIARGEDLDTVLEAMSKAITQKIIHGAVSDLHSDNQEERERAHYAIEHFFLQGCKRPNP
jgi:glutamyl-tRNA reductase